MWVTVHQHMMKLELILLRSYKSMCKVDIGYL